MENQCLVGISDSHAVQNLKMRQTLLEYNAHYAQKTSHKRARALKHSGEFVAYLLEVEVDV